MTTGEIEQFIEHYGKKGMHWGIRNKRPPSGSSGKTSFHKAPTRLSDAELSKRIKRMELEKKYNDLKAPQKSKGMEYVHGLLQNTGKTVVGAAVGGTTTFLLQRALKKKFGD